MTIVLGNKNKSHLAFGRVIIACLNAVDAVNVRMAGTHGRLCDGQCALAHGLDRTDLLLAWQHVGKVEQVGAHDGMIGTERSLADA